MMKRHYLPGDVVIRQGEIGHELFLVSDGSVKVERSGQEVARLGPGEFFGELALLSGNPRNADVIATGPLETYVLGESDFRIAMDQSESFRDQLRRVYFLRH